MPPTIPVAFNTIAADQRIAQVAVDIPFISILKMMFKLMAASFVVWCCFIPVIIAVWMIVVTIFAGLIGGLSGVPHP